MTELKKIILSITGVVAGMMANGQELYRVPENVQTRWISPENWGGDKGEGGKVNGGRKGSPNFRLQAGEEKILAEVTGTSGVVRRIWMTIYDRSPEMLRGFRIQMFWDGAEKPAVDAPLGDFFGIGLGRMAPFESVFFSSPEGKSFNCSIPMPFKKSMLIKLINETDLDQSMVFFDIDYTIGDELTEEDLYFHAFYNHQRQTSFQKDYEFLPKLEGKGRFLGVNIGVDVNKEEYLSSWWGEGEVKFYLDGDDKYPTLAGTGTEDYIGTAWFLGGYSHFYQGCPIADHNEMEFAFYRYHVNDPVYFHEDIRATIQQIGFANEENYKLLSKLKGDVFVAAEGMNKVDFSQQRTWLLFERSDDYSSCAYFYLDKPSTDLPELMPVKERVR